MLTGKKLDHMKVGITTFELENFDFQVQLNSMLKNNIEPTFIVLHYAGLINTIVKYFRFLIKIINQYRLKSLFFILSRNKTINKNVNLKFSLSQNDKNDINEFLKRVLIIKVK